MVAHCLSKANHNEGTIGWPLQLRAALARSFRVIYALGNDRQIRARLEGCAELRDYRQVRGPAFRGRRGDATSMVCRPVGDSTSPA